MTDTFTSIGDAADGVVSKRHSPGVYFNLPEDEYHADPALGSSDIKSLLGEPAGYWWNSAYNPAREERETSPAMKLGSAVHAAVLYGLREFSDRYGRCKFPGNIKAGMSERAALAEAGAIPLTAKDYDRAISAGTMIRANPIIGNAFTGGAAEVSVFWEQEVMGEVVRRKARLDYLKPKAIVDLKSHAPMDGKTFVTSCYRAIKTFNYPVQAAAYMDAIPYIKQFVAAKEIWRIPDAAGGIDSSRQFELNLIANFCAQPAHAFVFVFWASKGAPLTWGGTFSQDNPMLQMAKTQVDAALATFVEYRKEFGTESAWIRPEPLSEIDPFEVERWHARDAI